MRISIQFLCLLIILFAIDFFDFLSDWLQFSDLYYAEEGLVFGAFEIEIVLASLAFSTIGTVFFFAEIVSYYGEICGESVTWDYLLLFVATWLEDIPQIIITTRIASCRKEAISVIQLLSATGSILMAMVTFAANIWFYFQYLKELGYIEHQKEKFLQRENVARFASMPGLFIIIIGALLVFIFSNVTYDLGGHAHILLPKNLLDSKFHSEEYIKGVGVFLRIKNRHHPFGRHFMANNTWIKIADLEQIGIRKSAINIKVLYNSQTGEYFQIEQMKMDNATTKAETTLCYMVKDSPQGQKKLKICPKRKHDDPKTESLLLTLEYVLPNSNQVLGDILFNSKLIKDDLCNNTIQTLQKSALTLRYFKVKSNAYEHQNDYLRCTSTTDCHFFHGESDLIDIKRVWRTGYFKCPCRARKHPKLDPNLYVPCF